MLIYFMIGYDAPNKKLNGFVLLLALGLFFHFTACDPKEVATNSNPGASYKLTVIVKGNGSVSPTGGTFTRGEPVILTADPGENHVVALWEGTDNDASSETTNTVSMDSDKTVTVIFLLHNHGQHITNIDRFLESCPGEDPALPLIRHDFKIRRNGVLVNLEELQCVEPVSSLPLWQYTDELIVVQALRVIYHMDWGEEGHLPWTPGTLYRWLRSKIAGVDIRDDLAHPYCCYVYDGEPYVGLGNLSQGSRDFFRTWEGIETEIEFLAHEARHIDGFFHVSCCGVEDGCDYGYDESDISAYGIQWYLNKSWLMGTINIGIGCLSRERIERIANQHLRNCNRFITIRFCSSPPPVLIMPEMPGGPCPG